METRSTNRAESFIGKLPAYVPKFVLFQPKSNSAEKNVNGERIALEVKKLHLIQKLN